MMNSTVHGYVLLKNLLDYPDGPYKDGVETSLRALEKSEPAVAAILGPFTETVRELSVDQIQELYTRTFDINPVCTLEVGWHVYGEDYARGAFLVKMRELLRTHRIPESTELPDHLTHVLALLGCLDGEEADELTARYLLPALEKMLEGISGDDNPYQSVLEAIASSVRSHHPVEAVAPRESRSDPPGSNSPFPVLDGSEMCGEGCRPAPGSDGVPRNAPAIPFGRGKGNHGPG